MKKLLKFTLALTLACTLAACTSAKESGAKNAVNSYYVALEEGDLDEAGNYLSDTSIGSFDQLKEVEDEMDSMLEQYNVSDATKKLFSDGFKTLVKYCIKSHKITGTQKVSDTEYKVTAETSVLNSDDITNAISSIDSNSFLTDISSQVMDKYTNEGEAAATEFMMSQMATWLTTNFGDALKNLQPSTQTVTATVDLKDNNWLITNLSEQN